MALIAVQWFTDNAAVQVVLVRRAVPRRRMAKIASSFVCLHIASLPNFEARQSLRPECNDQPQKYQTPCTDPAMHRAHLAAITRRVRRGCQ